MQFSALFDPHLPVFASHVPVCAPGKMACLSMVYEKARPRAAACMADKFVQPDKARRGAAARKQCHLHMDKNIHARQSKPYGHWPTRVQANSRHFQPNNKKLAKAWRL
jgi:hypothetical protein